MGGTLELNEEGAPARVDDGATDPMLGRRLLHYRVVEVIGQGGMSVVYKGRDEHLMRDVAIKVLHPFLAQKAECRARLAREARAVARLEHPNILKIFDFSGDPPTLNEKLAKDEHRGGGDGFLVTELVSGTTLKRFAEENHLWGSPEVGCMVVLVLARALEHAHAQGVIHRDLKPENVMMRDDGVLKLMDFGIAQVVDQKQLTVTGTLIGSPAHMAPECIEGFPADARSDLFSLGTVLYWLTTGYLPFEALTPHALLRTIVEASYPPPQQRSPRVSDDICRVLDRALARRPEDRFQSASEMSAALEEVLTAAGCPTASPDLEQILAGPEQGLSTTSTRVRAAYLSRAEALLEKGSPAKALAALSRVLAEHPGDPDAERLLERAQEIGDEDEPDPAVPTGEDRHADEGPDRVPRGGLGRFALLGLAAAVLVGAVAMSRFVDDRSADLPTEPVDARAEPSAPVEEGMSELVVARAPEGDAKPPARAAEPEEPPRPRTAELGSRLEKGVQDGRPLVPARSVLEGAMGSRPQEGAAKSRELVVVAWPYADIYLDGERVAEKQPRVKIAVTPGRHTLRFEHPHAKTRDEVIDVPEEGELKEVRVRLNEAKPAYLRVESVPPDAEVAVDGVPKGPAKDSEITPIVVPFKVRAARASLEVMVVKPGYRPRILRHEFEAGRLSTLKVVLEPERDEAEADDPAPEKPRRPIDPGE